MAHLRELLRQRCSSRSTTCSYLAHKPVNHDGANAKPVVVDAGDGVKHGAQPRPQIRELLEAHRRCERVQAAIPLREHLRDVHMVLRKLKRGPHNGRHTAIMHVSTTTARGWVASEYHAGTHRFTERPVNSPWHPFAQVVVQRRQERGEVNTVLRAT